VLRSLQEKIKEIKMEMEITEGKKVWENFRRMEEGSEGSV